MPSKYKFLLTYLLLLSFFSAIAIFVFRQISHMQKVGVPITADLISYYEAGAGRAGPSAVYGRITFKVDNKQIFTSVVIGSAANASDLSFKKVTLSGKVPIVYDPSKPRNVVFNGEEELSRRKPAELGLMIALAGLFFSSIIFIPALIALWRQAE